MCDECKEKTNLDHCINFILEKQQTAFSMGLPSADSQAVSPKHSTCIYYTSCLIDHFTVVCLVALSLNESQAGVDLVFIETSLLFLRKFLLISMRTTLLA